MIPSGSRPARPVRMAAGSEDLAPGFRNPLLRPAIKERSVLRRRPTMQLVALLLSGALNACGALILSPVLPFYAINHAGADALDLALISSVYSLFQMLSSPLLGALSDKVGRRPVLLAGLSASAALYLLQALADTVPKLLLARAALGLAGGTVPVEVALLTELTTKDERPAVLGLQTTLITMGAFFGPAVGAAFTGDGFPFLCQIMGGVCLLNLLLGLLFFTEPKRPEAPKLPPQGDSFRSVSSRKSGGLFSKLNTRVVMLLVAAFMDCFALGVSDGPEAYFLKENFGFTEPHLAAFFMVCSASSLIWVNAVPRIMRQASPKVVCSAFSIGSVAAMSTLFFFVDPWEPYVYAFLSSFTVTVVETVSTTSLVNNMVGRDQQGTIYGIESALLNAGFCLGPPLGGYLYRYDHYAPYAVSVGCFTVSALTYACLPRGIPRLSLLLVDADQDGVPDPPRSSRAMQNLMDKAPLPNKNFAPRLVADRVRQAWFVDPEMLRPFKEAQRWHAERGLRKASSIHVPAKEGSARDLYEGMLTPH